MGVWERNYSHTPIPHIHIQPGIGLSMDRIGIIGTLSGRFLHTGVFREDQSHRYAIIAYCTSEEMAHRHPGRTQAILD